MSTNVHPEILGQMKYEQEFLQTQQKGSRRVKMERGKMWTIRFVPAQLGPHGTWFARIARHWLSMKPIICPRYTSPDFGGDPDADCPCCDIAASLNDSPDPEISKFGYGVQGNPQWLTYCVVFEKDGAQMNTKEILMPYEFNHYKSTFEDLMNFFTVGARRSPNSILDYKTGNDFVVTKTKKGLKLDKQDSGPIFDPKDPNFQAWIEKIEANIKQPKVTIPTNDQLYTFSLKIQDGAERLAHGQSAENNGGGGRARLRGGGEDVEADPDAPEQGYQESDEPEQEAPARPAARPRPAAAAAPAAAAPARRPAPAPEPEAEAPAPARPRRPAPAPAPEPEAEAEQPAEDDSNPELAPVRQAAPAAAPVRRAPAAPAATAAPVRRPAPAPVEPAAEAEEAPAPVAPRRPTGAGAPQKLQPSANRRAAEATAAAAAPTQEENEEEALPEEATDQAPPAEAPVGEAEAAEPPAVARRGGMGAQIRNKINEMSKRGA